jgi:hypothetical protein
MWIDPLAKWRPEQAGTPSFERGRAELLDGSPKVARQCFEAAEHPHELVGLGDALLLLGEAEQAISCYEEAARRDIDPFVECGLSQALVLRGDAASAVERLQTLPDDPVVRHHLTGALLTLADQVRSITRDEDLVITSRRQLETCAWVAERVLEAAVDDAHVAGARRLRELTMDGQRWMWSDQTAALGYSVLAGLAGLAVVVIGGTMGNIPIVVAGALLGAAAVYGIVRAHRRQVWQVEAIRVAPMVWRHGPA